MSRPFETEAPFLQSLAPTGEAEIVALLRRVAGALGELVNVPPRGGADALRLEGASRAIHLALVELQGFA